MIQLFIIFSIALILGALATTYGNNGFLDEFLKKDLLQISGLILGINIPSVIFLIGALNPFPGDYSDTIKEIKHNVYLMFCTFIVILVLSIFNPFVYLPDLCIDMVTPKAASQTVLMAFFLLQIYALYEIASLIFVFAFVVNKIKNPDKDNQINNNSKPLTNEE